MWQSNPCSLQHTTLAHVLSRIFGVIQTLMTKVIPQKASESGRSVNNFLPEIASLPRGSATTASAAKQCRAFEAELERRLVLLADGRASSSSNGRRMLPIALGGCSLCLRRSSRSGLSSSARLVERRVT